MNDTTSFHKGLIAVHFHGGFLDGRIAKSNDTFTGGFIDFWSAKRIYAATGGRVGEFMTGVAPDGFEAVRDSGDPTASTVVLHRYRVIESRVEDGTLILQLEYECVST